MNEKVTPGGKSTDMHSVVIAEVQRFFNKEATHLTSSLLTELLSKSRADSPEEIEKFLLEYERQILISILGLFSIKTIEFTKELSPDAQTGQSDTTSSSH